MGTDASAPLPQRDGIGAFVKGLARLIHDGPCEGLADVV